MLLRNLLLGLLIAAATLPARAAEEQFLDQVIAVVNDDVITERQLVGEMQSIVDRLRGQGIQLPPRDVLTRQVLDRMINTRLQMQKARELGIQVDSITLNNAVRGIARDNGMNLEQFRQALAAQGMEYTQFREDVRTQMTLDRLREQAVERRVSVSEKEIDDFLARRDQQSDRNTEYRLEHILVALPEAASPDEIDAARERAREILAELRDGADFAATAIRVSDGQQALQGGDLGWRPVGRLPSLFVDAVDRMAVGEIRGPIQGPSGFHIIRLADLRSGEQRQVITETRARHILVRPGDQVSDTQARLRVEELRARIEEGADFGELARTYSDDPGSAAEGGDLGWVTPGAMVEPFEKAMDATAVGALSEPVRSRFGWHVIEVLDRRQVDKTDALRRKEAREALRQRKIEEEMELWLRRLRDEAYIELVDARDAG